MKRMLAAVGSQFVRMLRDESGGETIEYALLGGVVAAMSYSSIESVGRNVTSMWQSLDSALGAVGR